MPFSTKTTHHLVITRFYIEECRESDRGYFFSDDKYIIDLWWDHNKDLYETKTPYMEIKK